jgi:hypothetical protein
MLPAFSWKKRIVGRSRLMLACQPFGFRYQACNFVPSLAVKSTSCIARRVSDCGWVYIQRMTATGKSGISQRGCCVQHYFVAGRSRQDTHLILQPKVVGEVLEVVWHTWYLRYVDLCNTSTIIGTDHNRGLQAFAEKWCSPASLGKHIECP